MTTTPPALSANGRPIYDGDVVIVESPISRYGSETFDYSESFAVGSKVHVVRAAPDSDGDVRVRRAGGEHWDWEYLAPDGLLHVSDLPLLAVERAPAPEPQAYRIVSTGLHNFSLGTTVYKVRFTSDVYATSPDFVDGSPRWVGGVPVAQILRPFDVEEIPEPLAFAEWERQLLATFDAPAPVVLKVGDVVVAQEIYGPSVKVGDVGIVAEVESFVGSDGPLVRVDFGGGYPLGIYARRVRLIAAGDKVSTAADALRGSEVRSLRDEIVRLSDEIATLKRRARVAKARAERITEDLS